MIYSFKIQLNLKTKHGIFGSNKCYGITRDPIAKDFIIIMDNYLLNDLIDHLLYKSGNKVVDDFIRYTQINNEQTNSRLTCDLMMEFVPYNQFQDIKFIAEGGFSKVYRATWIVGYIQGWNEKDMSFERSGPATVALKKLDNSENITTMELNEVKINLIINLSY